MAVSWLSVAVGCPLLSVTLPGWTGLAPARPGWDLGVQPGQPGTGLYRAVSGYTPMATKPRTHSMYYYVVMSYMYKCTDMHIWPAYRQREFNLIGD